MSPHVYIVMYEEVHFCRHAIPKYGIHLHIIDVSFKSQSVNILNIINKHL